MYPSETSSSPGANDREWSFSSCREGQDEKWIYYETNNETLSFKDCYKW